MIENFKKFRENLVLAKNYINKILKSMNDILIVIFQKVSIITINDPVCATLKYEKYKLIIQLIEIIFPKKELLANEAKLINSIQSGCASHIKTIYLARYM